MLRFKFIDDAVFIFPAMLTFIMLGGYISRKLKDMQGDAIARKENQIMADKINELVDRMNDLYVAAETRPLTAEEVSAARAILKDSKELFGEGE